MTANALRHVPAIAPEDALPLALAKVHTLEEELASVRSELARSRVENADLRRKLAQAEATRDTAQEASTRDIEAKRLAVYARDAIWATLDAVIFGETPAKLARLEVEHNRRICGIAEELRELARHAEKHSEAWWARELEGLARDVLAGKVEEGNPR